MYVRTYSIQDLYIHDLMEAVEAANQGVTVRKDTVSGSMFADGFVGISGTPEALQKQTRE